MVNIITFSLKKTRITKGLEFNVILLYNLNYFCRILKYNINKTAISCSNLNKLYVLCISPTYYMQIV